MTDALRFTASVAKVSTMADGGLRISIDLQEDAVDIASAMMQAKQQGAVLECAVVFVKADKEKKWRDQQD